MNKQKLKLAIVGCGGIVTNAHLPALQKLSDLYEITAACDANRASAEQFAAKIGLPDSRVFTDSKEVAGLKEVDAALVGTPHFLHHSAAADLIAGGKHVLIEKPFALNLKESANLVFLAEQKKVQLVVGHCQRHSLLGLAVKEILNDGYLGTVFGASSTALQYLPMYVKPESNHWLYSAEKAGGGIVISVGVHKLDLLRFLLGDVESVSALFEVDSSRSSAVRPFEWTAAINLKFISGAAASVFLSYKAYSDKWENETLQILGNDGTLRASGFDEFDVISTQLPAWARSFIHHKPKGNSEWITQLEAFHATATEGVLNRANARDALKTMAMIDAIYESGMSGGTAVKPRSESEINQLLK